MYMIGLNLMMFTKISKVICYIRIMIHSIELLCDFTYKQQLMIDAILGFVGLTYISEINKKKPKTKKKVLNK